MSKLAVVFWTGTGNTGSMADAVAEGARAAGAEVTLLGPVEFSAEAVASYDAIAFGCPAMGAEVLEEDEFEPMFAAVENALSGKKVGLFGSWGWGEGAWMEEWKARTEADGAQVAGTVTCQDAPDDAVLSECKALGQALA